MRIDFTRIQGEPPNRLTLSKLMTFTPSAHFGIKIISKPVKSPILRTRF